MERKRKTFDKGADDGIHARTKKRNLSRHYGGIETRGSSHLIRTGATPGKL
jgi:hypothetical protein